MASKRAVLETLKVKDLIFVADKFEIQLENRRKKDDVVASIAKTRKVAIGELLQALPLATLKASCASLDIEAKGRSKAGFVEALTGPAKKKAAAKPKAEKAPAKKKAATKPKAEKAPAKKKAAAKPKAEKAPAKKKAAAKPKAEKAPAKKKAAAKPKAEKAPAKKKAVAKPKTEKVPAKKKAVAKPKAEKAPAKKKAVAKPKAEKAPVEEKAAAEPKAEKAPVTVKKKKQPLINKAPIEAPKKEADSEPRQAVLDKVASIKPAETSQPDYSQIKKEYVGLEIQKVDCPSCATEVKLANCQAHQCSNRFVFQQRKICASCWYERSSVSIGEYLDEDRIDTRCAACSAEIDVESFAGLKSA
ncbi:MAG: hypothetical protein HOK97_06695 [Deltaproteobacteria bacterium]|jgi:hypothetical protein|nr:hypothetical protein [Deltaproteobacteria bacterium]